METGRTDEFDALPRADERECEEVRRKASYGSWNKIRDLRHTLIQYLLQQNVLEQERMKQSRGRKMCDDMLGACPC